MRRTRAWLILCGLLLLALVPGCGGCGGRERNKNSDYDRPPELPKPAQK